MMVGVCRCKRESEGVKGGEVLHYVTGWCCGLEERNEGIYECKMLPSGSYRGVTSTVGLPLHLLGIHKV